MFKIPLAILTLVSFLVTGIVGPMPAYAQDYRLPAPGVMVHLSPEFTPAQLQGITIHPDNALQFDFLINKGDKFLDSDQKKIEYKKLIKYFLASLTIPDEDQWVNLSPYEHNRIIKNDFGKTEIGRDLLAEDYILKQITSSLIYPEDVLGKKFWNMVYERAWKEYHTSNIPVNTFNKVWIVPDQAIVYESGNTAYILKSHLKVMLEEDYMSLQKHSGIVSTPSNSTHTIGSQVIREIILPELEKEVNDNKNFANLRQMYSGMILATWYKKALKESLLGRVYADKGKVKGVDQDPKTNEEIYKRYLRAFKKGVFNYIKEDVDKYTNEPIPRKYFSGGFFKNALSDGAMVVVNSGNLRGLVDPETLQSLVVSEEGVDDVYIKLETPDEAARGELVSTVATDNGTNQNRPDHSMLIHLPSAVQMGTRLNSLINALAADDEVKQLFASKFQDTARGYTLQKHTELVLNRFMEYFSGRHWSEVFDQELFLIMLILHDIGKPKGASVVQHIKTKDVIMRLYRENKLPFTEYQLNIILSVINGDPIGDYMREHGIALGDSLHQIRAIRDETGLSLREVFNILTAYYQSDSSSYDFLSPLYIQTNGGHFEVDSAKQRLKFSIGYEDKFKELENAITNDESALERYTNSAFGLQELRQGAGEEYAKAVSPQTVKGLSKEQYRELVGRLSGMVVSHVITPEFAEEIIKDGRIYPRFMLEMKKGLSSKQGAVRGGEFQLGSASKGVHFWVGLPSNEWRGGQIVYVSAVEPIMENYGFFESPYKHATDTNGEWVVTGKSDDVDDESNGINVNETGILFIPETLREKFEGHALTERIVFYKGNNLKEAVRLFFGNAIANPKIPAISGKIKYIGNNGASYLSYNRVSGQGSVFANDAPWSVLPYQQLRNQTSRTADDYARRAANLINMRNGDTLLGEAMIIAAKDIEEALRLNPDHPEALFYRGRLQQTGFYYISGQTVEESIKEINGWYERAIKAGLQGDLRLQAYERITDLSTQILDFTTAESALVQARSLPKGAEDGIWIERFSEKIQSLKAEINALREAMSSAQTIQAMGEAVEQQRKRLHFREDRYFEDAHIFVMNRIHHHIQELGASFLGKARSVFASYGVGQYSPFTAYRDLQEQYSRQIRDLADYSGRYVRNNHVLRDFAPNRLKESVANVESFQAKLEFAIQDVYKQMHEKDVEFSKMRQDLYSLIEQLRQANLGKPNSFNVATYRDAIDTIYGKVNESLRVARQSGLPTYELETQVIPVIQNANEKINETQRSWLGAWIVSLRNKGSTVQPFELEPATPDDPQANPFLHGIEEVLNQSSVPVPITVFDSAQISRTGLNMRSRNVKGGLDRELKKGGIDFNSANLALQIKRDGKGVPLPLSQQDMAQLSAISGFEPQIIEIKPALNVPIISELQQKLQPSPV